MLLRQPPSSLCPDEEVIDSLMNAQVFLGGSCGETTWRKDVAIPLLERAGISYCDPQLPSGAWTSAEQLNDMRGKEAAQVLLFVVSAHTASVAAVAEAAYLLAAQRPLALAVQDVDVGSVISGRPCDAELAADLNRGRIFLRAMAQVHGVPVFPSIEQAVLEAIRLVGQARAHLTLADVERILQATAWRSMAFRARPLGEGFLVWIEGNEPDARNDGWLCARGRPWFVHRTETESQVVQTLLKAALTWEEHEAREHFRFLGERIFDPHLPLEALLAAQRNARGGSAR
jgi:hypothetical protein